MILKKMDYTWVGQPSSAFCCFILNVVFPVKFQ